MKILDRYISSSVAAAFLSGVMVFMVLLCAMDLFKRFIEYVTEYNIPPGVALSISAYKIPGMLVYAFPMAVLLGILLVFARMSSESEMVAIRAAGVSFVRVTVPVLFISLLITGLTFLISNYFAPYANEQSAALERLALKKARANMLSYMKEDKATRTLQYSILASRLEMEGENGVMRDVSVTYYANGAPAYYLFSHQARWDVQRGYWTFEREGTVIRSIVTDAMDLSLQTGPGSSMTLGSSLFQLKESPFLLKHFDQDPADMRSDQIRRQVREMRELGKDSPRELGRWLTRLAQRYSTPFTCLVFALIGAPLGLRHHRTSSAVGFGISLLVIFAFYFVNVYVTSFGDSGALSPVAAAWVPNILGAILGIVLLKRANR